MSQPTPLLDDKTSPIYTVPNTPSTISAIYTGKGTSPSNNDNYSFHRPSPPTQNDTTRETHFSTNITHLAHSLSFNPANLTWPNGAWPHSGTVIKTCDYDWVRSPTTQGLTPVSRGGDADANGDAHPVTFDGVVTRCDADEFVLGVQSADCSSVFLWDDQARVIGLVHAGWKPLVRGAVGNAVRAMGELGARPERIGVFVSPGVGDRVFEFGWGEGMEGGVRDVFVGARREDLLDDKAVRCEMGVEDRRELHAVSGRDVDRPGMVFRLSVLTARELERCGVRRERISVAECSTLLDRYESWEEEGQFRYHSYRRERPDHGLSMSVLLIKPEQSNS